MRDHEGRLFTETLRAVEARAAEGPVTLGELLGLCGAQGHGFVALLLVMPFLQPIPLPGISTAIGLVLALIGGFVALGKPPWLPTRLARVSVERDAVLRICASLEKLLRAIEHVVRPRAEALFARRWFRVANGALWIANAMVFSLPLPIPLSNAIPALVILLLALGTLEEDVAVIALAWLAGLVSAAFFGGILVLPAIGWEAWAVSGAGSL